MCLPQLWHNFGIFFITYPQSFKTFNFKIHLIAFSVSLNSHVWTQKSYFTQDTYEHYDLLRQSCVCLPQLWHNFGIFFITCPLSFQILFFKFHMIARSISFNLHVWTQKSDITRATYEHCLFNHALLQVPSWIVAELMVISSYLALHVSKS